MGVDVGASGGGHHLHTAISDNQLINETKVETENNNGHKFTNKTVTNKLQPLDKTYEAVEQNNHKITEHVDTKPSTEGSGGGDDVQTDRTIEQTKEQRKGSDRPIGGAGSAQ